jgi:hypothetical protein
MGQEWNNMNNTFREGCDGNKKPAAPKKQARPRRRKPVTGYPQCINGSGIAYIAIRACDLERFSDK